MHRGERKRFGATSQTVPEQEVYFNDKRNIRIQSSCEVFPHHTYLDASSIHIPLPPVEIALIHQQAEFGAQTRQLKVLNEQSNAHHCSLILESRGGATFTFLLRENVPDLRLHADGANLDAINSGLRVVSVIFPDGRLQRKACELFLVAVSFPIRGVIPDHPRGQSHTASRDTHGSLAHPSSARAPGSTGRH